MPSQRVRYWFSALCTCCAILLLAAVLLHVPLKATLLVLGAMGIATYPLLREISPRVSAASSFIVTLPIALTLLSAIFGLPYFTAPHESIDPSIIFAGIWVAVVAAYLWRKTNTHEEMRPGIIIGVIMAGSVAIGLVPFLMLYVMHYALPLISIIWFFRPSMKII